MSDQAGKKLCPSCTTYVGVNDSICGNCGYNFVTGEEQDDGADDGGRPTQPLTVYSESSGPPRTTNAGRTVGMVILVVVLVIGAGVAFLARTVFNATEDVQRGIEDIDIDFTPGDIGIGTNPATDYDSCVRLLNKYLKKVLANDGQPDDLPTILQDAASEMGVGYEFRVFTTIYTNAVGTAVTEGTKPAVREAKNDAREACRREYGG